MGLFDVGTQVIKNYIENQILKIFVIKITYFKLHLKHSNQIFRHTEPTAYSTIHMSEEIDANL